MSKQVIMSWVDVDIALPDESHDTLLVSILNHDGKRIVDTDAFYIDEGVFRFWGEANSAVVTHWMPLPLPPTEEA